MQMQANICDAHSNATYKFMSLLPLLVCFKILIDPLHLSCYSPILNIWEILSPFVINYHKRWAQILDRLVLNHVKWDHFAKLVQSRILA